MPASYRIEFTRNGERGSITFFDKGYAVDIAYALTLEGSVFKDVKVFETGEREIEF